MLKIQRAANGEVVFTLSGRMDTVQLRAGDSLLIDRHPGEKGVEAGR